MRTLFLLAFAGALGTLARYGLSSAVNALTHSAFPWGIFITNILGSFLFGAVWEAAGVRGLFSDATRVILLTGFMGAFTTFSTFIFDTQSLLEQGSWFALGLNLCGQILLGLVALRMGIRCAALWF